MQTAALLLPEDAAVALAGCLSGTPPSDGDVSYGLFHQKLVRGQHGDVIRGLLALADACEQSGPLRAEARNIVDRVALVITDAALREELPIPQLQVLYAQLRDGAAAPGRLLREVLPGFVRRLQEHTGARDELLEQTKAYMAEHGEEYDFSMQGMAERLGVPLRELSHLFQQRTGQKLTAYLWDMRLAKAQKLLAETSLPIRQVVQDVGYMDVSSFTRKFRSANGCTPGEYRLRSQRQAVTVSKLASNA